VIAIQFRLYTLEDAAGILGVRASTLRQQVLAGKMGAAKMGPIWVTSQSDIERYRNESLGKRKAKS
jgi:hypothetical protein